MHRQNATLNSLKKKKKKRVCFISRTPLHLAEDAALSCPRRYVLFLQYYEGSEVQLNRPDVGQKCSLNACWLARSSVRGESCDLCEAGSHISTRAEQQ